MTNTTNTTADFKDWFDEDDHDFFSFPDEAMEAAWDAAIESLTATNRELEEKLSKAIDDRTSLQNLSYEQVRKIQLRERQLSEANEEIEQYQTAINEGCQNLCDAANIDIDRYDSDQSDISCYMDCFEDMTDLLKRGKWIYSSDDIAFSSELESRIAELEGDKIRLENNLEATENDKSKLISHVDLLEDDLSARNEQIAELEKEREWIPEVIKLCDSCNKSFPIKSKSIAVNKSPREYATTFENCPHCETRNDTWIMFALPTQPIEE